MLPGLSFLPAVPRSAVPRHGLRLLAAILLLPCIVLPAAAQPYPSKPVRLILSYPPGGATDALGRMLGRGLADTWGVPVTPDNRPGASGNIGTSLCLKAPPDGYTMCMVAVAQAMASRLSTTAPYDSLKDFTHVTHVASLPMLLLVHPALPVRNVSELVTLARKRPGALNYASSGGGASHHLAMELFKQLTGTDIVLIPYKGGGEQLADQLAGRVETAFNLAVGVIPHVRNGKLRALAVSTKERLPSLPDVPTMAESGLPVAEKIVSNHVKSLAIEGGAIHLTFGNQAIAVPSSIEERPANPLREPASGGRGSTVKICQRCRITFG